MENIIIANKNTTVQYVRRITMTNKHHNNISEQLELASKTVRPFATKHIHEHPKFTINIRILKAFKTIIIQNNNIVNIYYETLYCN